LERVIVFWGTQATKWNVVRKGTAEGVVAEESRGRQMLYWWFAAYAQKKVRRGN